MKLGWGCRQQAGKRGTRPAVAVLGTGWGWGLSDGEEESVLEMDSAEMVSNPLPPMHT